MATNPDGRVGPLDRLGAERRACKRGRLSFERDRLAAHEPDHDFERVLQQVKSRADSGKLDAERTMLGLEPRGTEREVKTTAGDVVDGDGLRAQN